MSRTVQWGHALVVSWVDIAHDHPGKKVRWHLALTEGNAYSLSMFEED